VECSQKIDPSVMRVCGKEERTISVSGRTTASLRRRWTTQQQPTRNQNNPQRLTLYWLEKPSPVSLQSKRTQFIKAERVEISGS